MTEQNEGSKKQTKNGWKYLSFVLIGILAFGVIVTTLPRAVAAPQEGGTGEQMMLILTQIQEAVFGIQETTNNIQAAAFTNVAMYHIDSLSDFEDSFSCTSDHDMIVHASVFKTLDGGYLTVIPLDPDGSGQLSLINITESVGLSFGVEAEHRLILQPFSSSPDRVTALITVQTAEGANVSCIVD